jgi:histidinol-phosphate/aromatic aminotransferase/cobyric acid decarboxylase-like protein
MRNSYFPTDAMFAAMRHALPDLVGNYGSSQAVLNEKLSYFLECDPGRVQVLNGASQAFPVLRGLFQEKRVMIPSPTFGEYPRTFPDAQTYPDKPGVEMDVVGRAAETCDVVVAVNPNSPTGTPFATQELYSLARDHPETTLVVDESFLAFSDQGSIVRCLERQPLTNVIVLTSLSKSLGIPGLRLGYLYSCDPDTIAAVGASLPVWNLNAPAEFLLELLLKFRVELRASLEKSVVDRENLRHDLSELDIVEHVHPSDGNFLLTCLVGNSGDIAHMIRDRLLADHRIEVKDVSGRFPDRRPRLRLAVRTPEDNARLIEALQAVGDST